MMAMMPRVSRRISLLAAEGAIVAEFYGRAALKEKGSAQLIATSKL